MFRSGAVLKNSSFKGGYNESTSFGVCSSSGKHVAPTTSMSPTPTPSPTPTSAPDSSPAPTSSPPTDCTDLVLEFHTDAFGEETWFNVTDYRSKEVVWVVPPGTMGNNSDYTFSQCLDNRPCYIVSVNDDYGDGM